MPITLGDTNITSSTGNVGVAGTGSLVLPSGTTAQRPASPVNGMIRYNTIDNVTEEYRDGAWVNLSNVLMDGSTAALAPEFGSNIIDVMGSAFSPGLYFLTGITSAQQTAQRVYVDSEGFMLFYRHAGTGGGYNATYGFHGDLWGEASIGTLNSPTQGLTDAGSSTIAGQRGAARLSTAFIRALGGNSEVNNVYRMTVGGLTVFVTDAQWWSTPTTSAGDPYGWDNAISAGNSYAGRRTANLYNNGATDRPLGTYTAPSGVNSVIPWYGQTNDYSGGYDGTWHVASTLWVRQF